MQAFPPPYIFVKRYERSHKYSLYGVIMGMLSVTIFAFLIVRSASPAHNKIFGAKYLSFERLELICLYTVCYAALWRSVMK